MQLQSDLSVNVTPFDPNAVTEKTKRFTDILIQNTLNEPKWWEVLTFVDWISSSSTLMTIRTDRCGELQAKTC